MDDAFVQWRQCRSVVRRILSSAQADDVDDIASDALLIVMRRGACHRHAVIDAIRHRYGKPHTNSWRTRRSVARAVSLCDATTAADDKDNPIMVEELAARLSNGCPSWVYDAMLLMSQGYSMKDAAVKCGRVYESLYAHLRR